MFDLGLGLSEIIFLAAIGLIIIGPKDLPAVLYKLGQWVGRLRQMANEFQSSFKQAMHQEEITRLKNEIEQMKKDGGNLLKAPPPRPTDSVFSEKEEKDATPSSSQSSS